MAAHAGIAHAGQPIPLGPAAPPPPPAAKDMRRVTVGQATLSPPPAEAVGLLDAKSGGLPKTLWRGVSAATVRALLPALPMDLDSPTLRRLAWRLLKSAGRGPAGDGAGAKPSFLALRVGALLALGDDDGAAALAALAPAGATDNDLVRTEITALMLSGHTGQACRLMPLLPEGTGGVEGAETRVLCQFRAGEHLKANLGLDLLRHAKPRDTAFIHAAEVVSGLPLGRTRLGPVRTLGAALAVRAAKLTFPFRTEETAPPPVLAMLATSDALPPARRLVAAERAAAQGVIDGAAYRAAISAAAKHPAKGGPAALAGLVRAAMAAKDPGRQLDLIAKALDQAAARGRTDAVCRVLAPLVTALTPDPHLAARAPVAITVLLAAGRVKAAAGWMALIRNDPAALAKVWPLARIWAMSGTAPTLAETAKSYADWRAAGAKPRQAVLVLGLLSALGQPVPDSALAALRDKPQPTRIMPATAELLRLETRRGSVGGVVLASLASFSDPRLDRADPLTLSRVVAALKTIGLDTDARMLATEAVLAFGS